MTTTEHAVELVKLMMERMTDKERVDFIAELMEEKYCPHCGSKHLPCYCWNDE